MKITNVNVSKIEKENTRLRGIATIILDDEIAIHNIRLIEGNNGLFISMPSRKLEENKYADIVHPIKKEVRNMIEEKIFEKYEGEK